MKQAKISIGLDIKPLKAEVGKVKDVFKAFGTDLKGIFSKDLNDQVKVFENLIGGCVDRLHDLHKASQQALNPKIIANYVDQYRALSTVIGRVARQQQAFSRNVTIHYPQGPGGGGGGGGYGPPPPMQPQPQQQPRIGPSGGGSSSGGGDEGGGFGGGGGRSGASSLLKGGMKMLGGLGIGFGIHAAIERELEHAEAGIRVRELTGNGMVSGRSRFGFTRMERMNRAGAIGAEAGRDLSGKQINGMVNQSEMFQRAFGITGEGYARGIGAARRGGSEQPDTSVANAIGDAVSMKLSGSAVGEYLAQMASYLDSMSKGVNIEEGSLRGFATQLGGMNFFKGHPERLFDALGKLDSLFKGGGNEFQNFSMYRATQEVTQSQTGRPMSPAGVANRRSFGLFGNGKDTLEGFGAAGMPNLQRDLGTGGDDLARQFLNNMFKESTQGGRGKDSEEAFQLFRESTGLEAGQAAGVYQTLGKGGKLNAKQVKAFKDAQKTPEERSKETMESYEGSVKQFGEEIDNIKNIISENFMGVALAFDKTVTKFDDAVNRYISKVLGVEEKPNFDSGAEAFTAGGASHGFAPTADESANYSQTEKGALPLLRGMHSQQFNKPYDKLNADQQSKVDREVEAHLERSRNAQLRKEAERIQAYQRFQEMGKDFDPKTSAEKDVAADAKDLSEDDLDAKYKRPIMNRKKFDAFLNGTEDDLPVPVAAKADGGHISGSKVIVNKDGSREIEGAGNKRAAEFFKSVWTAVTGAGTAAGEDFSEQAAKYRKKKGSGSKAHGGVVGFRKGGSVLSKLWDMISGSGEAKGVSGKPVDSMATKNWEPSMWDVVKDIGWSDVKGAASTMFDTDAAVKGMSLHAGGGSVGMSSIRGIGRGSAKYGTDTLMTALTPGEFVVNARDASRNMMALQHANAGGRISAYANGGQVGGGMEALALALGGFPSTMKLDSGTHQAATNANTHALHALARAIGGVVEGSNSRRDMPRGPRLKYG